MKIIIKFINEENIEDLKKVFLALDIRNTGFITITDLRTAMINLGYSDASDMIDGIVKKVDYLEHGKINYTEFLMATMNYKDNIGDQLIYDAFALFDTENKGFITVEDLKEGFMRNANYTNQDEIENFVNEYNFRNPENIEFTEFKKIVMQTPSSAITPFPQKMSFSTAIKKIMPDS